MLEWPRRRRRPSSTGCRPSRPSSPTATSGTWNVMSDGTTFVALSLDWEVARPNRLPLFDLAYFLAHALSLASGPHTVDGGWRPWSSSSPAERRSHRACSGGPSAPPAPRGVPKDVVAPLVVLSWFHDAVLTPAPHAAGGGGRGRRTPGGALVGRSDLGPASRVWSGRPRPSTAPGAGGGPMSDASLGSLHGLGQRRRRADGRRPLATRLATSAVTTSGRGLEVDLPFLGSRHRWTTCGRRTVISPIPARRAVRVAARDVTSSISTRSTRPPPIRPRRSGRRRLHYGPPRPGPRPAMAPAVPPGARVRPGRARRGPLALDHRRLRPASSSLRRSRRARSSSSRSA